MRPHAIESWHKVMASGDVSTLPDLLHEDAVERLAMGVSRECGLEVVGGMDVTGLGPDLDGGL